MDSTEERHGDGGRNTRVQSAILQALGCGKVGFLGTSPLIFSRGESVCDVPTSELVLLAVPFVNARCFLGVDGEKVRDLCTAFASDCVALGVVDEGCAALWRRTLCGTDDRADSVAVYRAAKGFFLDAADWEDREWLLGLLRHLFFRCLRMFRVAAQEACLSKRGPAADRGTRPVQRPTVYKIGACGHRIPIALGRGSAPVVPPGLLGRTDVLKRGGGPTMTLDEYADIVVANMRKAENQRLDVQAEKDESPEATRSRLVREDEANDQRRCSLGNTRGMG